MSASSKRLTARKQPIQARSTHTVEAIFEACIQVLLAVGPERLTTTRVAERAGVSVGTLYQYYGDKQSLLAAVLERHLLQVVEAVEGAAQQNKGAPLEQTVTALVNAFVDAKFTRPDISKALYSVAAELDGHDIVAKLTQRSQLAICELLVAAQDVHFNDAITMSFVIATALIGPVQTMLALDAPQPFQGLVKNHLIILVTSYLKTISNKV